MSPMKGLTTCAVQGCPNEPDGYANLCRLHKQPGAIAQIEGSTMVVTFWLVRHGRETGMVILNDYSLGNLHGGPEGFRAQLKVQGFTDIRQLATPEELHTARQKVLASWSGHWLTEYPWERGQTVAEHRSHQDPWEYMGREVAKRRRLVAARKRS